MTNLTFTLTKPARKSGGDKYTAEMKGSTTLFVIYFPQSISRADTSGKITGIPAYKITVAIEVPL